MKKVLALTELVWLICRSRIHRVFSSQRKDLRVVLVVGAFDKGGLEQVVLNLFNSFNKTPGCEAFLLVERGPLGSLADRIEKKENVYIYSGSRVLFARLLDRLRVNIVHYHYSLFGLELVRMMGLKSVYTVHNVYTWKVDGEFHNYIRKMSGCDRIISVSSWVQSYLLTRAQGAVSAVKAMVIPNGIDLEEFGHEISSKAIVRSGSEYLVVNVASITPTKHQALLVRAAYELRDKIPNLRVVLIGNVTDMAYLDFIKSRIVQYGLQDRVHFVDYLSRNDIANVFRHEADLMVLPSLQEGFANVVIEAMYTGIPMVLSDVGGARDVACGNNGVVVINAAYEDVVAFKLEDIKSLSVEDQAPNLGSLVSSIEKCYKENITLREQAKVNTQRVEEEYTKDVMAQRYLQEFKSL